jgi:aminoglycoside 3-N-acetyltransferase I
MVAVEARRLLPGDRDAAREVFAVMAEVFDEAAERLTDEQVDGLLRRDSFWVYAAIEDGTVVGGLTAHLLPMTRTPSSEVFVYDLAVHAGSRRRGIAGRLLREVRKAAAATGAGDVFVAADIEDGDALAFYREQGGQESPVAFFTFPPAQPPPPSWHPPHPGSRPRPLTEW